MTTALQIERRALGRSELIIPRVALGCGNFGGVGSTPELFGEGFSEEQALTTKTYNPMHAGGDRGLLRTGSSGSCSRAYSGWASGIGSPASTAAASRSPRDRG